MKQYFEYYEEFRKKGQRKGQAHFNAFHKIFPEEAEKIVGSNIDPFYRDENIDEFLYFVYSIYYES